MLQQAAVWFEGDQNIEIAFIVSLTPRHRTKNAHIKRTVTGCNCQDFFSFFFDQSLKIHPTTSQGDDPIGPPQYNKLSLCALYINAKTPSPLGGEGVGGEVSCQDAHAIPIRCNPLQSVLEIR
jgi:hypothetical protein